jgi:hypothetical protein
MLGTMMSLPILHAPLAGHRMMRRWPAQTNASKRTRLGPRWMWGNSQRHLSARHSHGRGANGAEAVVLPTQNW